MYWKINDIIYHKFKFILSAKQIAEIQIHVIHIIFGCTKTTISF